MVGSGEIPQALILVTKTGKKGKTGSHVCQSGSAPDPSVAGGQPGHIQQSKGWKCPQIPGFFPLEHSKKCCLGVGDFGFSQQSWGMFWSPPRKLILVCFPWMDIPSFQLHQRMLQTSERAGEAVALLIPLIQRNLTMDINHGTAERASKNLFSGAKQTSGSSLR